ncbi:MAG: hypothetical protein ACKVU1_11695 [bacterium]
MRIGVNGERGGAHDDPRGRTRLASCALCGVIVFALLLAGAPGVPVRQAHAGDKGMASIGKNAIYGALTGLLLGGVVALVSDEDSRDDAIRWGVVIGTFGGVAYGIYDVSKGDDQAVGPVAAPDAIALQMTKPGVIGSARGAHFRPAYDGMARTAASR